MKENETILSEKREKEIEETIIAPFQAIYNRRNKNNDILCPFAKSDYLEAQLIPCHHLTDIEIQHIFQQDLDYQLEDFMRYIFKMNVPAADYRPPCIENTPVKTLMSWYLNKKSKHVTQAREELTKRYPYLDPKDQSAFRIALLQSPNKASRIQGVRYCLHTCGKKEISIIQEIWRQNDDFNFWKVASKVLIRNSATNFLVKEQRKLFEFSDGRQDPSLYYLLSIHLYGNNTFEFNKEWLNIEDYYRLLYHENLPIVADEWENDIYRVVAEVYLRSSRDLFFPPKAAQSMTNRPLVFPEWCEVPNSERKYWDDAQFRKMSLLEIPVIRSLLLYASYAGLKEVIDFMCYAHRVDKALIDQFGTELQRLIDDGEYVSANKDHYRRIRFRKSSPYAEVLLQLCPEKYRHHFDEAIAEYEILMYQKYDSPENDCSENEVDSDRLFVNIPFLGQF